MAGVAQVARFGTQIDGLDSKLWRVPNYQEADVIVIAMAYGPKDLAALPEVVARMRDDGKTVHLASAFPGFPARAETTLADQMAAACLRDTTCPRADLPDRVNAAYFTAYQTARTASRFLATDQTLAEIVARFEDVQIFDRSAYICDETTERCLAMTSSWAKTLYDRGHHTLAGAQAFADRATDLGLIEPLLALMP